MAVNPGMMRDGSRWRKARAAVSPTRTKNTQGRILMKIQLALISVSDKEGVVDLARRLQALQIRILSTGGTGRTLQKAGIDFLQVSEHTGFPEILDGRVKTLHPRLHAGILANLDEPSHRRELQEKQIPPIGLVVVNLYPFRETIQRPGVGLAEAIEQIDIGGPSLIRAAAKNFQHVCVVVDPGDYPALLAELEKSGGETSRQTRFRLAAKAFQHTAAYDSSIARYLEQQEGGTAEGGMPPRILLNLVREASLRYGENPHQRAALYRDTDRVPSGLVAARQLQGKELSFNNYIDLDAAWSLVQELPGSACAIIKHTNPCGAAVADTLQEAYRKALNCDPVSAFGSIIGFNRAVDEATAQAMTELFVEAVIAPGYEAGALKLLAARKNLRVMEMPEVPSDPAQEYDLKKILGGVLAQERDLCSVEKESLKVATRRAPEAREMQDLLFAWTVCKHVKSNAIVVARQGQTLGVGAGQMSRVDSVRLAVNKARVPLEGAVLASDAFFPFRDGIDEAARVGVRAVIQPGGSVRDEEVIQAADEQGLAMVLTGIRHFKH